jgi:hypothetical protein
MAVPTSTITIRDIFNEINGTSHSANAQIGSGVTMSSLNAASNAFTSGTANHTGHNTVNNVLETPDTIAEWAAYTHSLSMGTIDYDIRMASISTADRALWGLLQDSDDAEVGQQAYADGGITLWRTIDGSNTYIKAKWFGQATSYAYGQVYDSSAETLTTSSSGATVITIPTTGVTITASISLLSGSTHTYTGTSEVAITGTGATLLVCKGAPPAQAAPTSSDTNTAKFHIALSAAKTGYTTTLLNKGTSGYGIIVHSQNHAEADEAY